MRSQVLRHTPLGLRPGEFLPAAIHAAHALLDFHIINGARSTDSTGQLSQNVVFTVGFVSFA